MAEQADAVRDVVVVGGGAAGLSAALTLARARRWVTVVDAGEPRNAPSDAVHGLLALDGVSPAALLARGREVLGYGGEILSGEVVDVSYGDQVSGVRLDNDQVVAVDVVVESTRMVARTDPCTTIGIELTFHPAGAFIESDAHHTNADLVTEDLERAVVAFADAQTSVGDAR